MHTVELLEQALELARRASYRIRQEWLDGSTGGACVINGQKWLFLDPTQPPREQVETVLGALWADPDVAAIDIDAVLQRELQALEPRKAA